MKRLFVASLVILIIFFGMSCNEKFFRIVLLPDNQNYSELYPEIFYSQTNILMALSWHVLNDGVVTLASEGKHKNKVYQVLANYQKYLEGSVNGGKRFFADTYFKSEYRTDFVSDLFTY